MPLYDYVCRECGPFREWQPMARSGADVACPGCGQGSKRAVSMPFLPCVSRDDRIAHERNERSADEPAVMRRDELDARYGRIKPRGHHHHGRGMYRSTVLGHGH
jgi:putative FmdB family regulatory protein